MKLLSSILSVIVTFASILGGVFLHLNSPQISQNLSKDIATVSAQVIPYSPQVLGASTSTTPATTAYKSLTESQVKSLISTTLDSYVKSGKFKGPKGDRGEKGEKGPQGPAGQGGSSSFTTPSGQVIQQPSFSLAYTPPGASNPGSIGAISYLSSKEITTDKITANTSITSNGSASITGQTTTGSLVTGLLTAGDITPSTAASSVTGVTNTQIISVTNGTWFWDDSQKAIQTASDTFPRIVYAENNMTDLKFVQCLDQDCATSNITTVDTNLNGVDTLSLRMAPDGYARILYINYNTPNELHFVKCNNSDCSNNVNTIVATQIYDHGYYAASFDLDSNGNAYIGVEDIDNGTSADHLEFYACTNADCTTKVHNELLTGPDTYYEMFTIAVGSDNFARIAIADEASPDNFIRYIQCTNTDCSINNNTIVDTDETHYSYYIDLVLDPNNNAYIAYNNQEGYKVAQCTNADCSSNNISVIDSSTSTQAMSIVLGSDGFPRISYTIRDIWPVHHLNYVQCANADCSSKNSLVLDTDSFYSNSITMGADGFPRIVYASSAKDTLYLARFGTNSGDDEYTGNNIGSLSSRFNSIYSQIVNADSLVLNGTPFSSSSFSPTQWSTSGSNIYYNTGSVSIGTTTPAEKLTIYNGGLGVYGTNSVNFKINRTGTAYDNNITFTTNGTLTGSLALISGSNDFVLSGSDSAVTKIAAGNSATLTLSAAANSVINFVNGGTEIMRVSQNGNIGIGTINPRTTLETVGTTRLTSASSTSSYADEFVLQRTVAQAVGSYVEIAKFDDLNGAFNLEVETIDGTGGGSNSKKYIITGNYDDQAGKGWYEVLPLSSTGDRGGDYALDIGGTNINGSYQISLRLRTTKTLFQPSGANIAIKIKTLNTNLAAVQSGAGTGATVSGIYYQTVLGQIAGLVGIGTTSPSALLHIGSAASGGNVKIANGYLCVDSNDTCTGATTAGTIYATNGTVSGGADVAENYPTNNPTLIPGDIVMIDKGTPVHITRATNPKLVLGIVSTKPGVLLGSNQDFSNASSVPVALSGRVPVRVSNSNGNITAGDYLTLSTTTPGYAVKATESGQVVGQALEDFDFGTLSTSGQILVFVKVGYQVVGESPDEKLDSIIASTTDSLSYASKFFAQLFTKMVAWMGDATNGIKKLLVGEVETNQICLTDSSGDKTCLDKSMLDALILGTQSTYSPASNESIPMASSSTPQESPVLDSPSDVAPLLDIEQSTTTE